MLTAEKLKKNNIAEYLIHMYQSEDMLRAFDMDMAQVQQYVLKHIPDEADRQEMFAWYKQLHAALIDEGKQQGGHLDGLESIREQLSAIHDNLLKNDRNYRSVYVEAFPFIQQNKEVSEGKVTDDVQVCLNGVYGFLLLRLNGREVNHEEREMIEAFSAVLRYLSNVYHYDKPTESDA